MTMLGRIARHRPALSAVIIGTLALGIGSATALYSVIEAVLLRPFPFRDQDRLVMLWQADVVRNHPFVEVSYPDARDWRTRTEAFESMAAMSSVNFATTLTGLGDPRQLQVRVVAEPFFDVLGSPALVGRTLTRDEHQPGSGHVVVIGHALWQSLGGDRGVVGKSITLDREPHTIVGVMPPDFRFPEGAELWTPVEQAIPQIVHNRVVQWMVAVGRLKTGVSLDEARAALDITIRALAKEHRPTADEGAIRAAVRPLVGELLGPARQALLLLLCAVGAVLLIACANVSNLLMNYAVSRRTQEIGVRIALGAGRMQITGMVLKDGLRLALLGVSLGIVAAFAATGLLRHLLIGVGPRHPAAFAGAAALLCLVAAVACFIPARRAAAVDPMVAMRSE